MKKLQETEYMYGSARVRALENHIVGRERMNTLIEARSVNEVLTRLAEYGLTVKAEETAPGQKRSAQGTAQSAMQEQMLLDVLKEAYAEVEHSAPEPAVFAPFRYPYDCNNIKAAVKCRIRGIPADVMLFDFGTVPASDVERVLEEKHYDVYPPAMAAAIPAAEEAYAKSRDPQQIDAILDAACYADMLAVFTEAGNPVLIDWLRAKIDLTNLMICLRIIRMRRGTIGRMFLQNSLLPGGTWGKEFFLAAYDGGEDALWASLPKTRYAHLGEAAARSDKSLSAVERIADDEWMALVRQGAKVPFGAPVLGGYLIGCEVSVKNIRIILAAKEAGLDKAVIRGRVRESYV